MAKNILSEEQKEAYVEVITELRCNAVKGKTTKGSIGKMDRALKKLGFSKEEVTAREDLYFI